MQPAATHSDASRLRTDTYKVLFYDAVAGHPAKDWQSKYSSA